MIPHRIEFVVPGRISAWKRAGRKGMQTFTPAKMRSDQAQVKWFCAQAMRGMPMLVGPLKLTIMLHRTHPKSWSAKKKAATFWITGTPDCDNYVKQIGDALNGVAYGDDSQFAILAMQRRYADGPEEMKITIEELAP